MEPRACMLNACAANGINASINTKTRSRNCLPPPPPAHRAHLVPPAPRVTLDSRDLRSCSRSIGSVHGLLKRMEIPLGEMYPGSQQSSRGDRIRAMTGLTVYTRSCVFRCSGTHKTGLPPHAALELLLTRHVHASPHNSLRRMSS